MSALIDEAFGHWLAGFIDGEGHFAIHRGQRARTQGYACRFQVKLRDDDAAILHEIAERTNIGRVRVDRRAPKSNSRDQVTWIVWAKTDALALVELLDRFPLRAKKRRDYEIWREAVHWWTSRDHARGRNRPPGDWSPMAELKATLEAARKYPERSRDESVV